VPSLGEVVYFCPCPHNMNCKFVNNITSLLHVLIDIDVTHTFLYMSGLFKSAIWWAGYSINFRQSSAQTVASSSIMLSHTWTCGNTNIASFDYWLWKKKKRLIPMY